MPLPTSQRILVDPLGTLPPSLHRTRQGGLRPHCSAYALAAQIAAGMVIVTGVSAEVEPGGRLPRQVGSESEDHRRLRAVAAHIVLAADPGAVIGTEVTMAYEDRRRRFDLYATTNRGTLAGFMGAVDGRDIADLLARNRVAHCMVLPFGGLGGDFARGFIFSRAGSPFTTQSH